MRPRFARSWATGRSPGRALSAFAEFENITSANDSIYFDGIGVNTSGRTIIADPNITELNQAYGNLALTTLGSFDLSEHQRPRSGAVARRSSSTTPAISGT